MMKFNTKELSEAIDKAFSKGYESGFFDGYLAATKQSKERLDAIIESIKSSKAGGNIEGSK